jgi:hypothetical protein
MIFINGWRSDMGKIVKFTLFMGLTLLYHGIKGCMDFQRASEIDITEYRPAYEISSQLNEPTDLYRSNSANQSLYQTTSPRDDGHLVGLHGQSIGLYKQDDEHMKMNQIYRRKE